MANWPEIFYRTLREVEMLKRILRGNISTFDWAVRQFILNINVVLLRQHSFAACAVRPNLYSRYVPAISDLSKSYIGVMNPLPDSKISTRENVKWR